LQAYIIFCYFRYFPGRVDGGGGMAAYNNDDDYDDDDDNWISLY
jgi:hypothetical protein